LASCETGPAVDRPPEQRLRPVPRPPVPPASVPCAFDPGRLCVSDAQMAAFVRALDAALGEANARICWVRVFYGLTCDEEG
jgi:hypothetical protein